VSASANLHTPGCALKVPTGNPFTGAVPQIRFGVNDTVSDAQRLRGIGAAPGYTLHVFFITPFANNARVCQGFSIRPVINPGAVSLSP